MAMADGDGLFGCRRAAAKTTASRNLQIASPLWRQEKFLERRARVLAQVAPLLNRHQHGGLNAAQRDDLRSFLEACFQQLAEPRFCVLNRPVLHWDTHDNDLVRILVRSGEVFKV